MIRTAPESMGIYEAKTHFASVIERVFAGEIIVVTKHGKPVARICPIEDQTDSLASLMEESVALRAAWGLPDVDMRSLIGRDDH
jgi:prevent-host-death family protein